MSINTVRVHMIMTMYDDDDDEDDDDDDDDDDDVIMSNHMMMYDHKPCALRKRWR